MDEVKAQLLTYLRRERDSLLWKLDGLGEYDVRRPMTPTGTNLLGLVKHVASVTQAYLGVTFGRPGPDAPWLADDSPSNDADMWATADETRAEIVDYWHRVWAHADATVESLPLDAPGRVPWWPPERSAVTLGQIMIHLIAEVARHAGQADIVRESIDGAAGIRADRSNLAADVADDAHWSQWRDKLEAAARAASGGAQRVVP